MNAPDPWNSFPKISLTELPSDALPFFGAQTRVILDIRGFLLTEALEDLHGFGRPFHVSYYLTSRFRNKGVPRSGRFLFVPGVEKGFLRGGRVRQRRDLERPFGFGAEHELGLADAGAPHVKDLDLVSRLVMTW